jgi:hypothetical protein
MALVGCGGLAEGADTWRVSRRPRPRRNLGGRESIPGRARLRPILTWLVVTKQLDIQGGLKSRLTRPLVAAFVQDLLAVNTAQSVISRLNALHRFARATQPDEDWSFLWQLQRPLQPKVRDSREKAARLRHTAELIQLARSLMSSLPKDCSAQVPIRAAIAYRDGMMVGLLALRPLRLRNFTAITLGRHLVQRAGTWWIVFGADETKTKRPIETPFPKQLLECLEIYLWRVRPALLQRGDAARHDDGRLWLGWDGRPLPDRRVHQRISHRTERAFGRSMFSPPVPGLRSDDHRPRRSGARPHRCTGARPRLVPDDGGVLPYVERCGGGPGPQ